MRKIIPEGESPFAERPPLKKRLIRGLAITVAVVVVAIGGLVWFRFQPAFTKESQAAIKIEQPAWGTAAALAPRAPESLAATAAPVSAVVGPEANKAPGKDRSKARNQRAKPRNQAPKMPPQVAKTPN